MNDNFNPSEFTFYETFQNDETLQSFGQNALSLFVLDLYLGVDDIEAYAADTITDGGNDKKIDFCDINLEGNAAIIGQSYLGQKWGKEAASANKASYLNTGMAWLLSAHLDSVPAILQPKAQELRNGIANGEIEKIEIFFIHNAFSSLNVKNELQAVANATADLAHKIAKQYDVAEPRVSFKEFGLKEIEELFKSIESNILIDDWLEVPADSWITESSDAWESTVTTVPAEWIRKLRQEHGDNLVSANFRNYLGSRAVKGNINHQIKQTVVSEPENFWVFNNGITALCHEIKFDESNTKIRGISIINGAQTSGSLGESRKEDLPNAKVLIRFVKSSRLGLIDKIIQFNNTQNKIVSSDRRSNEPVLKNLAQDFKNYGISFIIRRTYGRNPKNSIVSADIARILAAFHGRPQLGYRNPSTIFDDDSSFNTVFPQEISVEHIFLVNSLAKAYDSNKTVLKSKVSQQTATRLEEEMFEVLKYTSSRYFIIYVMGFLAEQIKGTRIVDLYTWKATPEQISANSTELEEAWKKLLDVSLPLIQNKVATKGENAAFEVPRSASLSKEVASEFQALFQSTVISTSSDYALKDLRKYTTVTDLI